MGEYPAYDDHVYDAFDRRDARHRAYREAIRSVAAGTVVLDIGTGRDALWAVEAARSGARHVYAIEADGPAARQAARAVTAAGLGDRVTVIAGHSTEQALPVRAEVCVSEIVGNIASAEGAIAVLDDARRRLTAPGCAWIPFRMQTWAAAVDLTAAGDLALATEALPYLDAVFAAAGGPFDLRLCLAGPAAEAVISSAAAVESEIFDGSPHATAARRTATLRIATAARMTGLLLWARVAASARGGREIDALAGDTRGWAPVYVPFAMPVARGQEISLGFARIPGDDGVHPDYEITVYDRPPRRLPHHGGPFRGTPFYAALFPPIL
jgi:protein arginine N-methyltransferase 1